MQSQLKQALDAALAEARKAARPGQVEVQTGNFSLYPRYAGQGQRINGWQGTAELVVEGRDMPAIGQLTGRITTMTIARVGYGLSRERREGRGRSHCAGHCALPRQGGRLRASSSATPATCSARSTSAAASRRCSPAPMYARQGMSAAADEACRWKPARRR